MLTLPSALMRVMIPFAPLFAKRVWTRAQVLVAGAILSPGKRTVTSALRVMGLGRERHFQNYHRVLNRAAWSTLDASRVLVRVLVDTFAPTGPLILALDDTVERRRGARIKAKGIYRDPVRSSHSHFVKASGLRWLSLMLTVRIPWAERVWALPVLTALCPSERYYHERGRGHTKLTARARQMLRLVQRWLPGRRLVVVADASFAALELLEAVCRELTVVTRLRLDAALYDPAPKRRPGTTGRPRKKGARRPILKQLLVEPATAWRRVTIRGWYGEPERAVELASETAVWFHSGMPAVPIRWVLVRDVRGEFEPQALLCTDLGADPAAILAWFVRRWQTEVTFEEARRHLGVETRAAVGRQGHCAHHPDAPGALFVHHCDGPPTHRHRQRPGAHRRVVRERTRHLLGRDRPGAALLVESLPFFNVARETRHHKSAAAVVRAPYRNALLRRVNGQSRA